MKVILLSKWSDNLSDSQPASAAAWWLSEYPGDGSSVYNLVVDGDYYDVEEENFLRVPPYKL